MGWSVRTPASWPCLPLLPLRACLLSLLCGTSPCWRPVSLRSCTFALPATLFWTAQSDSLWLPFLQLVGPSALVLVPARGCLRACLFAWARVSEFVCVPCSLRVVVLFVVSVLLSRFCGLARDLSLDTGHSLSLLVLLLAALKPRRACDGAQLQGSRLVTFYYYYYPIPVQLGGRMRACHALGLGIDSRCFLRCLNFS